MIAFVAGVITRGNVLSLEIGVHWDPKKILKFAFFLKFDISLLLIKMRSINGIYFPL